MRQIESRARHYQACVLASGPRATKNVSKSNLRSASRRRIRRDRQAGRSQFRLKPLSRNFCSCGICRQFHGRVACRNFIDNRRKRWNLHGRRHGERDGLPRHLLRHRLRELFEVEVPPRRLRRPRLHDPRRHSGRRGGQRAVGQRAAAGRVHLLRCGGAALHGDGGAARVGARGRLRAPVVGRRAGVCGLPPGHGGRQAAREERAMTRGPRAPVFVLYF
mmetsp:Transcript_80661/g.216168  ORF Transcript_80661/g.216168 Transcript_80661/m.216168 type:complete len:219 (+) Transcript_80661:572-1228(+)